MAYKKREDLLKDIEILESYILDLESKKKKLENENKILKERIEELEASSVQKIKNERNAGRKRKLSNEEIAIIDKLHLQGKSIRFIAKEVGCSVGLVHKIINEPIKER
ncbi:MAG: helix-turn-helix domain-containing protein [Finegoldia magna]|nr:helix-turn-helix domain-containing protein [Finegoldia magna]